MLLNLLYFCWYLLHFLLMLTFVKTSLFIKIIVLFSLPLFHRMFHFFLEVSSLIFSNAIDCFLLSFVFSYLERCSPVEVLLAPYPAMFMFMVPASCWQVSLLPLPLNIGSTPVVGEPRRSFVHFAWPTKGVTLCWTTKSAHQLKPILLVCPL